MTALAPDVEDLLEQLSEVQVELAPVDSQRTIAAWLEANRFTVEWEVHVANRGDDRGGRVDLVGRRAGLTLAIEIDKTEPKRKSIVKLRQIPNAVRVVVVRAVDGAWAGTLPDGIDAVVRVGLKSGYV